MNNYSWLQRRLHHLALSTQFMREAAFDAERSFISSSDEYDNHVFIAGLARSGTTVLLNALYESGVYASLTYKDMPFVLAPNLWSKFSIHKQGSDFTERAHEDGIEVSTESPEAFEEVFWKTFNEQDSESLDKYKIYIKLIKHRYQKKRYLSKSNQNIRRLNLISNIFPNSNILIPYRDPIQQAYSLLMQHNKFILKSKKDKFIENYMKWTGHIEFGPHYIPLHQKNLTFKNDLDINHWLEQWYLTYKGCLEFLDNNKNLSFICHEQLCRSQEYWFNILKILRVEEFYDFSFKESKKEIPLEIDSKSSKRAYDLYVELNHLFNN